MRAYPSLVDEGETVGLRALESPEAQALNMRVGTRRLLALTIPSPLRQYQAGKLGNAAQLALVEAPHASPRAVLEDAATAAISSLMARAGGPVWDEASFQRLRDHVAGHAADETARIVAQVVKILQAARDVRRKLDELRGPAVADVRRDVAQQLGRLVFPGFITPTGADRLADVERYLRGAEWRLERLSRGAAVDRDRMRAVHELEDLYRHRLEELPAGRRVDGELAEVPWLLEELRMSQFAQAIGHARPGVEPARSGGSWTRRRVNEERPAGRRAVLALRSWATMPVDHEVSTRRDYQRQLILLPGSNFIGVSSLTVSTSSSPSPPSCGRGASLRTSGSDFVFASSMRRTCAHAAERWLVPAKRRLSGKRLAEASRLPSGVRAPAGRPARMSTIRRMAGPGKAPPNAR